MGIAGSQHFAKQLTDTQMQAILAYINVDMVGTKNPTALVLDADKSSVNDLEQQLKANGMPLNDYAAMLDGLRSIPSHQGDAHLQQVLSDFLKRKNIPIREDVSILVASDTAGFLGKVPVASIILFNEQIKGDVLEFAPCYHQACDDLSHIDPASLQLAYEAVLKLIEAAQTAPLK
ncbi:M28 family peptidase [uncultured Acinetobacter sp.]|uniref:M28 family peptidase n=1 Tax=uncultured Acinetobacter sp. TaxID=165433 RepID=UPI002605945F|nr:M28 family peptidase [uncultured Acinetobacter sp.]